MQLWCNLFSVCLGRNILKRHWHSQGFSTGEGGKARERSDRAGVGVGRGVSPRSHGREIFLFYFVHQNGIFCTLNVIIRGRLCEVAYTNPLLPLLFIFYSNQWGGGGGGAWALAPVSYACSNSGAARICQPRTKARERRDRAWGGCGRAVGRKKKKKNFVAV